MATGAIQEIAERGQGAWLHQGVRLLRPGSLKFGVTEKVTDVLEQAGLAYEIYSDIKANPTIENVQTGVAAFKASGADYIIAIGGGSSMDTAKAVGIIVNNPEFADVRSPGGRGAHQEPRGLHHRRAHHRRHRGRGHHQLRHHRRGEASASSSASTRTTSPSSPWSTPT